MAKLCTPGVHAETKISRATSLLADSWIKTTFPQAIAVPFESYTEEQGEKAVHTAKAIVSLVRQKLRLRKKG